MPFITGRAKKPVINARILKKTATSFRKGLNTYLLDSELNPEEARRLDNLKIVGKGILEPRGGTAHYFSADFAQTVRHIFDFYTDSIGVQLCAISDAGYLVTKSGTSYSRVNGASFPSGARMESVEVYGKRYIVDGVNNLKRYDGTTLLSYTLLSKPTSLTVTKSSGTSGVYTLSYRVAHESDTGTTDPTTAVTIANMPALLSDTQKAIISWANGSPSSLIRGTIIYGRESGAETYMVRVPASVTSYIDDGTITPSLDIFPEETNTTQGPIAEHIFAYQEKLILGNISSDPSMFMWTGSGPYIDRFHYSKGGGYYSIEKQSEDRWGITGIAEREGKFIIFKGLSIYQGELSFNEDLGINEAQIVKLVSGIGCPAGATIKNVENSVMFVGYVPGRGLVLAKLDYEPNILSPVLRFQPISARIQSVIDAVNYDRVAEMHSTYFDKKYHWFIPIGASSWRCIVYDVERLAFVGPWTISNAFCSAVHLDSSNQHHLLVGKSDGKVLEVSDAYDNDEGTDFTWTFLSKDDDLDEPFRLKTFIDGKVKLRNVTRGSVTISYLIKGKNGLQTAEESTTVQPQTTLAGWGSRAFAAIGSRWGYQPSTSTSNSPDVHKYTLLNKANSLSAQIQIQGTGSKAQIIATEVRARAQSESNIPSNWRE